MLHCNMTTSSTRLQLGLEDLLGELQCARRTGDLGRLALLAYCEVRRWARLAGEETLAEHASRIITDGPQPSRAAFEAQVDTLILELEHIHARLVSPQSVLHV